MKPLQIVLLLAAGVLGGALVTKVWHRPQPQPKMTARVEAPAPPVEVPPVVSQPATPAPPVAAEPVPISAPPERKPSPLPVRREVLRPRPVRSAPPPANPRPVNLGERVGPPAAAAPPPVIQAEAAPPTVSVPAPPPVRSEPEHVTPAPLPAPIVEPRKVTLNAGMLIPVRLVDGLSSERNAPGDTFSATLDRELAVDGFVIAERGARVDGRVVSVGQGGRTRGTATLAVEITRIYTSDGQVVSVETDSFERRAERSRETDAMKVGGGAIIGAIIGGIAGGGKGAAIGAGVGGGAGAGDVMLTRGRPAKLPSETRINFRLRSAVKLTEKRG
jgi:hypothetical protein